ncbi:MAG TPA: hypothetical protein VFL47_16595, partial [Flavisolibacter sp.]|nr:hypothetical protein [Flavisolibacter sp.]
LATGSLSQTKSLLAFVCDEGPSSAVYRRRMLEGRQTVLNTDNCLPVTKAGQGNKTVAPVDKTAASIIFAPATLY